MRPFERIIFAALALCLIASAAAAQCTRPNDCLPPQGTCRYRSANQVGGVCYPGTSICVRDLELQNPSSCTSASNGFFDVFADFEYRIQRSTDSGLTWGPLSGIAPSGMHFQTVQPPPVQVLDTEMLQLDLIGGGMHIRESPSRPSLGQTRLTQDAGGYHIDSFFDVFTELSLDGGQTWMPGDQPLQMSLGEEPTAVTPASWGKIKALYR